MLPAVSSSWARDPTKNPRFSHSVTTVRTAVQRAMRLEYLTVGWNALEVVVTVGLGIAAGSLALVAFGLDSLVEIFASVTVLWQLHRGSAATPRAMAMVGLAFLALAAFLLASATIALATQHEASDSPAGIAYLAATAFVMFLLAHQKRTLGVTLGNHPLATEARLTFLDGVLATCVLLALVANALAGAWWADPLGAGIVGAVAVREGIDAWRDSRDPSRMSPENS